MQINIHIWYICALIIEAFKSRVDHLASSFLWEIGQNRGKGSRQKWYLSCNLEGRLKTKFAPLCLFSFIKNLLDYRGLSAKMRFAGWSTLLLKTSKLPYKVFALSYFKYRCCKIKGMELTLVIICHKKYLIATKSFGRKYSH